MRMGRFANRPYSTPDLRHQARFANPGLANHGDDAADARPEAVDRILQGVELGIATDEWRRQPGDASSLAR
jgi:hypothetical protein